MEGLYNIDQVARSVPFDNATNGFTSTDVQTAIEEVRTSGLITLLHNDVYSTTLTTTTNTNYNDLDSMTITPPSGDYLVLFNASVTSDQNNILVSVIINSGIDDLYSERTVITASSTSRYILSTQGRFSVNGATPIKVRWKTSGSTARCFQRSLIIIRLGPAV